MNKETPNEYKSVTAHYIKNELFRTVYVSGVYGGFTPEGLLNVNFFTERATIPQQITITPIQDGQRLRLEESNPVGKQGITRELQVGTVMSIQQAQALQIWLADKIEEFNRFNQ
ncbi:hypothetical protein [Arsenicibacter rosenii]|uniref:Uncharacterized protein n=1 Tax=Arsenicibacter rosenii TaxID=1750698 RepID=A0A1S2VM44_9BACT|nr:hypothetical protein [Arsenicibacter rosenii]OIN59832.1 hypothetical protein BLX24_08210 [Arsenicibacter rosenii]